MSVEGKALASAAMGDVRANPIGDDVPGTRRMLDVLYGARAIFDACELRLGRAVDRCGWRGEIDVLDTQITHVQLAALARVLYTDELTLHPNTHDVEDSAEPCITIAIAWPATLGPVKEREHDNPTEDALLKSARKLGRAYERRVRSPKSDVHAQRVFDNAFEAHKCAATDYVLAEMQRDDTSEPKVWL